MNRWVKIVSLLLIAVVLVIVIAPDLDLPRMARLCNGRQKVRLVAFTPIIPAGILLLGPNSVSSLVRSGLHSVSDVSSSLIDLNCPAFARSGFIHHLPLAFTKCSQVADEGTDWHWFAIAPRPFSKTRPAVSPPVQMKR